MTGFTAELSGSNGWNATGIRKQGSGEFPGAHGWTDSRTYVAVERRFLASLEMNVEGFIKLGRLVLHELCHHEERNGSHTHDEYFYREFHDSLENTLPEFVTYCVHNLPKQSLADLLRSAGNGTEHRWSQGRTSRKHR